MSRESEERHMGATVSLNDFTIYQPDTEMRPDKVVTRSVQWVCHAINESSSICAFSTPKNQHI